MFDGLVNFYKNYRLNRVVNDSINPELINATFTPPKTKGKTTTAITKFVEIAFKKNFSRSYTLEANQYAFTDIRDALDVEGIFRRSVDKYIELMWKNGFKFIGKNLETVEYIKKRFREIAKVTDKSTYTLFNDISEQLIPYYNCFIVKVRDEKASSGSAWKTFDGTNLKPVAGYFVLPTHEIQILRDAKKQDLILGYYQTYVAATGLQETRFYNKEDVIHISIARKGNIGFGTPAVFPLLDDIRTLRRMEENVELLVFQHSIPLYHYAVGTDNLPGEQPEVDIIESKVQSMPSNGSFITNERVKIQVIGGDRNAIDAAPYLEYFKQRLITGLGMSSVGLGGDSGANRATALLMERNTLNVATKYIKVIKDMVDFRILEDLLGEGGYDTIETEENLVHMYVDEINIEDKVVRENHATDLWLKDILTREEARSAMGLDPLTPEQLVDTYWESIGKTKALIQAVDEPYTTGAGAGTAISGTSAITGKSKPANAPAANTPKAAKSTGNKSTPQNQFGRKIGPTTAKNDMIIADCIDVFEQELKKHFMLAKDEVIQAIEDGLNPKASLNLSLNYYITNTSKYIIDAYLLGIENTQVSQETLDEDIKKIQAENVKSLIHFIDSTANLIEKNKNLESIVPIFEVKAAEIKSISKNVILFANSIGEKRRAIEEK